MLAKIKNIINAYLISDDERTGKRWRTNSIRASGIGDICERRLLYEIIRPEDSLPLSAELLSIFRLGKHFEGYVVSLLKESGIDVIAAQVSSAWDAFNITGHIDGKILVSQWARAAKYHRLPYSEVDLDSREEMLLEMKGLNPNTAQQMNTVDDLLAGSWTRRYVAQILIYLLLENLDRGLLLIINKSSGELTQIEIRLEDHLEYAESLIQRAERLNMLIDYHRNLEKSKANAQGILGAATKNNPRVELFKNIDPDYMPLRINDIDECPRCQFRDVCCPTVKYNTTVDVVNDPDIFGELKERLEITPHSRRYSKLTARNKERFVLADDESSHEWLVSNEDTTDAFRIIAKRNKAGNVTRTIKAFVKEKDNE